MATQPIWRRAGSSAMISLFMLFSVVAVADEHVRTQFVGNTRFVWHGPEMEKDERYAYRPAASSTVVLEKYQADQKLYSAKFTTNKYHHRTSSAATTNKMAHLIVVSGSLAYGDGVDDDQTFSHFITDSTTTHAYNMSYIGWGLQQAIQSLTEPTLKDEVVEPAGQLVYLISREDIYRATGKLRSLSFAGNFPRYFVGTDGKVAKEGTFAKDGDFWQRWLFAIVQAFPWTNQYIERIKPQVTADDRLLSWRLLEQVNSLYLKAFPEHRMLGVIVDDMQDFEELSRGSAIRLVSFQQPKENLIANEGHWNENGHHAFAEFLTGQLALAKSSP